MSDSFNLPQSEPPARLAPLLVDTLRRVRQARLHVRLQRERCKALSEALHTAIAISAEQNQTIDRLRAQNQHLRDELRRYARTQVEPGKGRAA